jgi:hypothetical protein
MEAERQRRENKRKHNTNVNERKTMNLPNRKKL